MEPRSRAGWCQVLMYRCRLGHRQLPRVRLGPCGNSCLLDQDELRPLLRFREGDCSCQKSFIVVLSSFDEHLALDHLGSITDSLQQIAWNLARICCLGCQQRRLGSWRSFKGFHLTQETRSAELVDSVVIACCCNKSHSFRLEQGLVHRLSSPFDSDCRGPGYWEILLFDVVLRRQQVLALGFNFRPGSALEYVNAHASFHLETSISSLFEGLHRVFSKPFEHLLNWDDQRSSVADLGNSAWLANFWKIWSWYPCR
jgi:hypothetical protein